MRAERWRRDDGAGRSEEGKGGTGGSEAEVELFALACPTKKLKSSTSMFYNNGFSRREASTRAREMEVCGTRVPLFHVHTAVWCVYVLGNPIFSFSLNRSLLPFTVNFCETIAAFYRRDNRKVRAKVTANYLYETVRFPEAKFSKREQACTTLT